MDVRRHTLSLSNKSVEAVGISDYKQAIAEFIWNGFDAKATSIDLNYEANSLGSLLSFTISDNGEGIDISTLDKTFGFFLDSQKRISYDSSAYVRGKRGKGRFSFSLFANKAIWNTTFKSGENYLNYYITIEKSKQIEYSTSNPIVYKAKKAGTTVSFFNLINLSEANILSSELNEFLCLEFGWFLFLNKEHGFAININGEPLDYTHLIAESEVKVLEAKDENDDVNTFKVTFIRWKKKFGDKYYYYFIDESKKERTRKHTSFNNKPIDFHHSIYVESQYFNDFVLSDKDSSNPLPILGKNKSDKIFKSLLNQLHIFLSTKEKTFLRLSRAKKLIDNYDAKNIFPSFKNNKYDNERKKDLIEVVTEIYCLQPKIFEGLKEDQSKTLIGFLNLVLDTDERNSIISVIEEVIKLNSEEREEFSNILQKTSLTRIVRTIKLIESRYSVIMLLKSLVFDLKRFSTERDNIQKAIQENYWLFGEQFHLVSADETFERLLSNYIYLLDGEKQSQKINKTEKNRRPDIFICRQRTVPDPFNHDGELEENIMVELKRPSVDIGKKEVRQIEDYLDFIIREDQFNSQTRKWTFIVISNKVDDYVRDQYQSFKDKGKRFLIKSLGNYEIFAMTWDDVFKSFELRHKYLYSRLDLEKIIIEEELETKGIKLSKATSDNLTTKIKNLSSLAS